MLSGKLLYLPWTNPAPGVPFTRLRARILAYDLIMNRKLKLALAALLGFSAACSSVKKAPREQGAKPQDADTVVVRGYTGNPRIRVMYGVPSPAMDSIRRRRLERMELERTDTLPPVAERPREEDEAVPAKK